jgi:hypothetical protein
MPFDLTKHFMLYAIASENFFPHLLPPSRREMEILFTKLLSSTRWLLEGREGDSKAQ